MKTKQYNFYEQIIKENPVSVITAFRGFFDCSVAGYNFSCIYNIESDTYSMLVDRNGSFDLFGNSLSKKLLNKLKSREKNG